MGRRLRRSSRSRAGCLLLVVASVCALGSSTATTLGNSSCSQSPNRANCGACFFNNTCLGNTMSCCTCIGFHGGSPPMPNVDPQCLGAAGRTECSQQSSTCLACLKASAVGQWYDGLDRCASGCGCDNMMMQAEWTNRWRCNSDTFHQCLPTVVQEANSGDLAWCRSRCGARPPGASTCNGSGPGTCWRVPPLSPWPPWPPGTGCTVKPGSPPIYEKYCNKSCETAGKDDGHDEPCESACNRLNMTCEWVWGKSCHVLPNQPPAYKGVCSGAATESACLKLNLTCAWTPGPREGR